jgi:hypothetical protein
MTIRRATSAARRHGFSAKQHWLHELNRRRPEPAAISLAVMAGSGDPYMRKLGELAREGSQS